MRFVVAALLMLVLTTPVWAQQPQPQTPPASTNAGHVFGSATCRQKITCPGDLTNAASASALASSANACMADNFGTSNPSGLFDDTAGLDGAGCLTPKQMDNGKPSLGQCCLITLADKSCTFECKLILH